MHRVRKNDPAPTQRCTPIGEMLERVIVNGIPVYKDKDSNIAYIYDTEQIAIGRIGSDGSLQLNADWQSKTAGRLDEWRKSLQVRQRAPK